MSSYPERFALQSYDIVVGAEFLCVHGGSTIDPLTPYELGNTIRISEIVTRSDIEPQNQTLVKREFVVFRSEYGVAEFVKESCHILFSTAYTLSDTFPTLIPHYSLTDEELFAFKLGGSDALKE